MNFGAWGALMNLDNAQADANVDVFQRYDFVEECYGDSYRLMTLEELSGPVLWREQLTEERRPAHDRWVDAVDMAQGSLPANWRECMDMYELPEPFWGTDQGSYLQCTVLLKCLHELPEFELAHVLLSWFGVSWPGNPFIWGANVLCEGVPGIPRFDDEFFRRGTVAI